MRSKVEVGLVSTHICLRSQSLHLEVLLELVLILEDVLLRLSVIVDDTTILRDIAR